MARLCAASTHQRSEGPDSVRNRQIIRLESIRPTLIHSTARDDQQQQQQHRRANDKRGLFPLLEPISSLIGRAPNWRRPGHSFRLLIQVTPIQREQSGPHVRCRVGHRAAEAPVCEAAQPQCNPNNRGDTWGRQPEPPPPPRRVTRRPTLISGLGVKANIL